MVTSKKQLLHEFHVRVEDPEQIASTLSQRFGALLRHEFQYRLAKYSYIRVLPSDSPAGEIRYTGVVPIVSTALYFIDMGRFETISPERDYDYWLELMTKILLNLAQQENSDPEPIMQAHSALESGGENTIIKMTKLTKSSREYLIEAELQIKGVTANNLLFVRLTERKTGRSARRLIAQCNWLELPGLANRLAIAEGNLILHHRPGWSMLNEYRSRGFITPIKIPLSSFVFS